MGLTLAVLAVIVDFSTLAHGDRAPYKAGETFTLTGHVIAVNAKTHNITLWKNPDAFVVHGSTEMLAARQDVLYRVDGHLELRKGWQPRAYADRLVPVRSNILPEPVERTAVQITTGSARARGFVRVQGTIIRVAEDLTDPSIFWLTLKDQTGAVSAYGNTGRLDSAQFQALVGATVRLTGSLRESVTWRSNLPPSITLARHRPVEIVTPAETDPTHIPAYKSHNIIGRQRIQGVVIARTDDRFYLDRQKNSGKQYGKTICIHPSAGQPMPRIGDTVTVAGFASLDSYHLRFDETLVRITGHSATTDNTPQDVSICSLYADGSGRSRIAASQHGHLIRVRGTVRDLLPATPFGRRIEIEEDGRRLGIDVSPLGAGLPPRVEPGAIIEVDGILLVEFEPSYSAYALPPFRRFTVLPRAADDIRILRPAPWWTPKRLFGVILALLGALVGTVVWNRQLKRLSEKRGEELYREKIARASLELKVAERTRLATEIHDSISQTLTGIALQFDNGADEQIVRQMLASCRHELKSCLWDLRSRTFEEKDMTEAVRRAIKPSVGRADVAVRFNVPRSDLSESTTHAILRIIRELVVNAVGHGKATRIRIAGEKEDDAIRFSVTDNGGGFDPTTAPGAATGHFGLQGIRERLVAFRGRIEIDSRSGETRMAVTLHPNTDESP